MTPWAGADGPDRVRGRGSRPREHGRGGRRRRADHAPVERQPRPGSSSRHRAGDSAAISPPWATTSWRAIARPSPEPRESSPFTNRSKTCGSSVRVDARARCRATSSRIQRASSIAPADRHAAAGRRVAEGVGDEVGEDLADPDRVDVEDRQVAVDVGRRARRRPPRPPASNERTTSATSRSGSVGSRWSGERAGLGQRQRPQVVDEPPRTRVSSRIDGEVRRVGRVDAVDDRLEVALDDASAASAARG